MRPNFFTNTPDILHEYLQHGGPPAFKIRAVLAAMLSPTWGIYSGYELCENVPIRPGSEEYLDSEKYQYRPRDWEAAARAGIGIAPITSPELNAIRRAHPALHRLRNLRFHARRPARTHLFLEARGYVPGGSRDDTVLVVVNLDPLPDQGGHGLARFARTRRGPAQFIVTDELTGESYRWGQANYVRLEPGDAACAHLLRYAPSSNVSSSEVSDRPDGDPLP